jgi:hypothetical protein
MATRSRTSFQKRQKEIARMEKQRDKLAKRAQRKLSPSGLPEEDELYILGEDGLPILGEDGAPLMREDLSDDNDGGDDLPNSVGTPSALQK